MKKQVFALAIAALAAGSAFAQATDTLAKIKASGAISLGVRDSSALSFTLGNGKYAGFHTEWDELVVRGSMEERNFVAFYRKDGRVLAAVAINRGRDLRRSVPLIKVQDQIEAAKLRDPGVDLRTLVDTAGKR